MTCFADMMRRGLFHSIFILHDVLLKTLHNIQLVFSHTVCLKNINMKQYLTKLSQKGGIRVMDLYNKQIIDVYRNFTGKIPLTIPDNLYLN